MNRLLAYVTSLLIFLVVLEGGVRLLGMRPTVTINQFHDHWGWAKEPSASTRKKTSEYDITFKIDSHGLRDDDVPYEKPQDEYRILVCGDSFTLGYTVDRSDLFVDLVEHSFKQAGLNAQVVNGGTEGYSTDQELLWMREEGLKYQPDLVVLAFYQNDIYWNSQTAYTDKAKPRFPLASSAATPEKLPLTETGRTSWLVRHSALASFAANIQKGMRYRDQMLYQLPSGAWIPKEDCVVLTSEPPFIGESYSYTRACLEGFKRTLDQQKIPGLVALIPSREQVQWGESRDAYAARYQLLPGQWDPDLPTKKIAQMCTELGLETMDPLPALRGEFGKTKAPLYFTKDWHFNAAGNHVFADQLLQRVNARYLAAKKLTIKLTPPPPTGNGFPTWVAVLIVVWLVLSGLYALSYRDERPAIAPLKVGLMIALVVGIVIGVKALAGAIGGKWILLVLVLALIGFAAWKPRKLAAFFQGVGRKFGIMREVVGSFVDHGLWYMLPLLVGMLTLGSLLVVAASSPFIAPFIYTLF